MAKRSSVSYGSPRMGTQLKSGGGTLQMLSIGGEKEEQLRQEGDE